MFAIMDNELKNFRLNIKQLAAMTDLHRQTIASRLSNIPVAPGSNPKLKLYSVLDILVALLTRTADPAQIKVDEMLPPDRKAWFQSERERLKFEQKTSQLIPASDVTREFSSMAKAENQSSSIPGRSRIYSLSVKSQQVFRQLVKRG
ncbi:DUF1441 family protein [Buttiauxella sp. 3AFRM03]|nr:DUF1441 family protein [Buttiauxella sp. 3AFRM03]